MSDSQFTITIVIQIFSILATLLLGAIAIWGNVWRLRLAGPKLVLEFFNPKGERINDEDGREYRYYHVSLRNERRASPANNVRILLTKMYLPNANNKFVNLNLVGPVQLNWRFSRYQLQFPTIGSE